LLFVNFYICWLHFSFCNNVTLLISTYYCYDHWNNQMNSKLFFFFCFYQSNKYYWLYDTIHVVIKFQTIPYCCIVLTQYILFCRRNLINFTWTKNILFKHIYLIKIQISYQNILAIFHMNIFSGQCLSIDVVNNKNSQGHRMYHDILFHSACEQKSAYSFSFYGQSVEHHVEMINETTA